MAICEYNSSHSFNEARSGPHKKLLFPDGRRLDWYGVCRECINAQQVWEQKRAAAMLAEQERRRAWHKQVAERDIARREQIAARREQSIANALEREKQKAAMRERVAANAYARDMAKIARLESELDALRKKYQIPT